MKKRLSSQLYLIKTVSFAKYFQRGSKKHKVILGVGGNVGNSLRIFHKLLIFFQRSKFVELIQTSPILKNPPFGYLDQPDFYNCVVVVKTDLNPHAFLRYILAVEKKFKRKRSFKDAPRSLDLDIIFFSNFVIQTDDLTIPHPKWSERESVVIPLRYLYECKNF